MDVVKERCDMRAIRRVFILTLALFGLGTVASASGPVGVYGIIERVVLEPNDASPQRVQVWGVFAFVNGCAPSQAWETSAPVECGVNARLGADAAGGVSSVRRGFLYFKVPDVTAGVFTPADVDLVRREWRDLAAVAGTGQAVAFGRWGFVGNFTTLNAYERAALGGIPTDLRVRPGSEAPTSASTYQTNAGVVKINPQGSHARIVELLRSGLRSQR